MSIVNWGELYYSTLRAHGAHIAQTVAAEIEQLPIEVAVPDMSLTQRAAELHWKYKLPYADCFAAALAASKDARILTTDRDFDVVRSTVQIEFL
jgi:predicted nucleic acid-binding protein